MAPRRRSRKNANLPPYLYETRGYYTYQHPKMDKGIGLGTNRAAAVSQAIEANKHFEGVKVSLLDRITGKDKYTVSDWIDQHGTTARRQYIKRDLGDYLIGNLTALKIDEWLDEHWADKARMRQAMLGAIKTELNNAIGKGWISVNPASALSTESPHTKRDRLTLDEFLSIHANADAPLKRAMELAIMTCARRVNICALKFSDVQDGHLHITHAKAKKGEEPVLARYPLSMYLPALKSTLGDIIARCRDNVVSAYMIHHVRSQGRAKAGYKYRDKTIEQMWREAREAAGVMPRKGKTPQTFHEIKSLAKGLWEDQGYNTQAMCGHKTSRMGDLYRDRRGKEWVTVGK